MVVFYLRQRDRHLTCPEQSIKDTQAPLEIGQIVCRLTSQSSSLPRNLMRATGQEYSLGRGRLLIVDVAYPTECDPSSFPLGSKRGEIWEVCGAQAYAHWDGYWYSVSAVSWRRIHIKIPGRMSSQALSAPQSPSCNDETDGIVCNLAAPPFASLQILSR